MVKKLQIAVVGLGEQTIDNLLPSLRLSEYVTIVAVCDLDILKLNAVSRQLGFCKMYEDYKEMINSERLDAIIVCSYPDVHFEVAKYAIQNYVPVFVEKPPTRTTHQLKELIALSSIRSVITGVGMNFSYTDNHKLITEVTEDVEFGQVKFIAIDHVSSKPLDPLWNFTSIVESFLLAQLIHPLDYLLRIGGEFKSIDVFCSDIYRPFFIQLVIQFEGMIGTLRSGSFFPRFRHEVEIVSDLGNVIRSRDLSSIEVIQRDRTAPFNLKKKYCSTLYSQSPLKSGYTNAGYITELNNFFRSILKEGDFEHTFSSMLPIYETLDFIKEEIDRQFESKAVESRSILNH